LIALPPVELALTVGAPVVSFDSSFTISLLIFDMPAVVDVNPAPIC
jgi:hypothetical protein